MSSSQKQFISKYEFITGLKGQPLASITSAVPEPKSGAITDCASLNFLDGSQIVLESSYHIADLLFCEEEDVLLDIREEKGYEVVSNTGPSTKITSILVNETPTSVKLLFDEVCFIGDEENARCFPVGLFVTTPGRRIGIWREMLEAFFLSADYSEASMDRPYSLRERWEGWDSGRRYIARRCAWDFISEDLATLGEIAGGPGISHHSP